MRKEAAITAAPGVPGEKQGVRCKNPKCKFHWRSQFITRDGFCRNRKCGWKLPSGVAIQVAPFVPRPNSAAVAMQLALGKQLEEDKEDPF
jgi:hypothetical protein